MTVHIKSSGTWVQGSRIYLNENNVWVPVQEGWVKRSGVWTKFFELDVTPPPAPLITLSIINTTYGNNNNKRGRHIRCSVSIPGANNPDIALVRVLTTYQGKGATTQFGATYTAQPDARWPNEPWSEWRYDSQNHATTNGAFKTWPRSATDSSQLTDNQVYHFTGWSLDRSGNWSSATAASIKAPPEGGVGNQVLKKESKFTPVWTGTVTGVGATGFNLGQMIQQGSPRKNGILGYGNTVEDEVGEQGPATLKSAQLRLSRSNDSGSPTANIYVAFHAHNNYVMSGGWVTWSEHVKLGTLAKGETKWFDVPANFWENIEKWPDGAIGSFRGWVFLEKAPNTAAAQSNDYSVLKSLSEDPLQGQLHLTWEEML